jgi:hypothetical protein
MPFVVRASRLNGLEMGVVVVDVAVKELEITRELPDVGLGLAVVELEVVVGD